MRGKNIQYNDAKYAWFSPEEATEDNINYLVCAIFTRNVYQELLNISIPLSTTKLMNYFKENIGSQEFIVYSYINSDNEQEMKIYSQEEENKFKIIQNPSIDNIINLVQVGDIITFTGHSQLIYDIVKDSNGKVIDAIIMHSTQGNGYVNSKIPKEVLKLSNGVKVLFPLYFFI